MNIDIELLKNRLQLPLPGWEAQQKMAPEVNDRYRQLPESYRKAGVMALIYKGDDKDHKIIIIRRAADPRDKHAGQLGFPGGKYEESDTDMQACAIREVYEEIGVNTNTIQVLGALTPLYVFASNFLVSPYVGYIDHKPELTLQESEVAEVLHVSLAELFDESQKMKKDISIGNGLLKDVPYYNINGNVLWGATAIIMSELEAVCKS